MLATALVLWLAADPAALEYRGYVNDFANVISDDEEREIARYLKRVDEGAKAQIALVTINSLDGQPIDDFTFALARKWGVGYKNKDGTGNQADQGVLVVFAIKDRKMRIETGRGIEDAIPDGFAGDLLRAARPALRQNQYGTALSEIAHRTGERIAQVRGVTIPDRIAPRQRVGDGGGVDIPWWVILLGIIFVLWFLSKMGGGGGPRRMSRGGGWGGPVFLPPFGGGGHGGHSSGGGGFGGYDSGDSFGGFGGGDFGGGGASSDW